MRDVVSLKYPKIEVYYEDGNPYMSLEAFYLTEKNKDGRILYPKISLSQLRCIQNYHTPSYHGKLPESILLGEITFFLFCKDGVVYQTRESPPNINNQINIFKTKLKAQYPGLVVNYSYDITEDYYDIWHTNKELQFEDIKFRKFVGKLIKECFYSKNIFNFSFGYNYKEEDYI